MDENSRCEQVSIALRERSAKASGSAADSKKAQFAQKVLGGVSNNGTREQQEREDELRQWYEDYCGSCRVDYDELMRERQDSSPALL